MSFACIYWVTMADDVLRFTSGVNRLISFCHDPTDTMKWVDNHFGNLFFAGEFSLSLYCHFQDDENRTADGRGWRWCWRGSCSWLCSLTCTLRPWRLNGLGFGLAWKKLEGAAVAPQTHNVAVEWTTHCFENSFNSFSPGLNPTHQPVQPSPFGDVLHGKKQWTTHNKQKTTNDEQQTTNNDNNNNEQRTTTTTTTTTATTATTATTTKHLDVRSTSLVTCQRSPWSERWLRKTSGKNHELGFYRIQEVV